MPVAVTSGFILNDDGRTCAGTNATESKLFAKLVVVHYTDRMTMMIDKTVVASM